jgi:Uncharacterized conserved protein (DUF2249)/Hemerythrin HHE cation binding domain
MDELTDSLNAQHALLARQLDAVIAAGRAARWPEYHRQLGALGEGLVQHMTFEEEALFPHLERRAATEVKALREGHAGLRRQLEMLGAAAPEQDPEGCVAALGELAALLHAHHEAEMALDPQYASRPTPALMVADAPAMDLRGLQPPEPIERIFQALEHGPGAPLRVILPHEPVPLYGLLRERGYSCAGAPRPDGGFEVLIQRP